MIKLKYLADVLRSKNAGPFFLTFDLLFDKKKNYSLVKNSNVLNAELISKIYGVSKKDVYISNYDKAKGIKITIPRKHSSGSINDTDVYGAQQHIPLMDIEVY